MKRFFVYEMKKNIWTLLILTAIAAIPYVTVQSFQRIFYRYEVQGVTEIRVFSPNVAFVFAEAGILATVVPMLMYSFKMNKRSVDEFYSLPIKREKMYLVKTLVGLILTLVPYTVAYWAGFLSVAVRPNYYHLVYYVPGYFLGVLFAVCIYGVNSFAFARANRVADGVLFILFYTLIGWLAVSVLYRFFPKALADLQQDAYLSFGCLGYLSEAISDLVAYGKSGTAARGLWNVSMFVYPISLGAVAYFLLFYLVRFDKGEDAEQNSVSWFGYRTMIPVYTALLVIVTEGSWLGGCLIGVSAVVMTVVYTRKIKFGWRWVLIIAVSLLVGALGCLLIDKFVPSPYRYDSYDALNGFFGCVIG